MPYSVRNLREICKTHVVELKFVRRNKMRTPSTRRMLCTLDSKLLNSALGMEVLNFKRPRYSPPYNAAAKGLCTVWDIIMQDWRNVPSDSVEIVMYLKTQPNLENKFWEYFDKVISKMTKTQKRSFMDK